MVHPAFPFLPVNRFRAINATIVIEDPIEFETPSDASNLFGLAWSGRITVADQAARLALTKAGKINGTLVEQTSPKNIFVLANVDALETGSPADAFTPLLETVAGTNGTNGTNGSNGAAGATGATGATGSTGSAGAAGSVILNGASAPGSGDGVNGDYYLETTHGRLYGPKTVGAWSGYLTLKGSDGTNGTNGSNGTNGANGTNGTDGTVISAASATLTKIVAGSAAAPAVETLYLAIVDPIFSGATAPTTTTLTINGTAQSITYGFGTGNVDCGTQDPDTLAVTWNSAPDIMTAVADYINAQSWGVSAVQALSGGGAIVTVTTSATGSSATIASSGTGASGEWHARVSPGPDAVADSGTRQVELAAALTGKAHRLHSASFAVGATGWATADAQIGYWDGSTFSPLLKIPLASLTSNASGFNGAGGIAMESMPNLITPVASAALVARSSIAGSAGDETTGDDLTLYATYSTE